MPRNLSRLKFKAPKPPQPLNLSRIRPDNHPALEKAIRKHVLRQSKLTTSLGLQVVVHPKWKQQPGNKTKKLQFKPHTLRDIVDPECKAKHGQLIYVFRNTRTNQVIYSLSGLLDKYHLEQLPFIGKHSKPPELRRDEWIPHCVATFPSAAQGLHAFRKLREFRKLHELSWDKTNPEWINITPKERMEKIMDQVANTSADLAEVLNIQEQQGELMRRSLEEQQEQATQYMDKKWPEIDELANASLSPERDADNTKWLENQIKSLTFQLGLKTNQNEAEQKRLKKARRSHEVRLRKILYAQRKAEQFKKVQERLDAEAELANGYGAEEKLSKLQDEVHLLQQELANPGTGRTKEDIEFDRDTVRDYEAEIARLEKAFAAKRRADARDHYIARSVLPPQLKKQLPNPFTMEGVEIKWADLLDAEYALGKWPAAMINDVLPLRETRQSVHFMSAAEYEAAVEDEVVGIVKAMERQALVEAELEEPEPELVPEKTGVWKYLPEVRNPFKRAEA